MKTTLLAASLFLALTACGGGVDYPPPPPPTCAALLQAEFDAIMSDPLPAYQQSHSFAGGSLTVYNRAAFPLGWQQHDAWYIGHTASFGINKGDSTAPIAALVCP